MAVQHRATSSLHAQTALAETAHWVDGVRLAPSAYLRGISADADVFAAQDGLYLKAAAAAADLARFSPDHASIRTLVDQLNQAMKREMTLIGQHNLAEAQAVDASVVEQVYVALGTLETAADPVLAARVHHADRLAAIELAGLVTGAGMLLTLLLVAIEASRRRHLRTAVQQEGLRASEERFRVLVQNSSDIITVVDADSTVLFQGPSVRGVLGHDPDDVEGAPLSELVHADDLFRLAGLCGGGSRSEELRIRHRDGGWRICEARAADLAEHPGVGGVVLNIRDMSERKTLEEELRHQAFHDALTGLANRALFADRLEHALSRQGREGEPLGILLVDLDDFKAINDSLGHGTGDRLLAEVATRLRASVRASDTVARLGGDEFAILLEDPSHGSGPGPAAERVLSAFATPIHIDGRALMITASVGAAMSMQGGSVDELVRNADVAMYVAKAQGKSRWTQFEPGMHVAIQERLQLKTDLADALAAGDQMELYYQPVVNLESGGVVGVEALLRWNHPTRGVVAPLDFLPLAEDSGLIVPLGRWVLQEACAQAVDWKRRLPLDELTMSVNVSARQLDDPQLVADVAAAIHESGLDPACLVLEITETVLMREADSTVRTLGLLKGLGVRIAIDDFGTGYSSLGYLQHFPVDVLKIDRSFTVGLGGEARQAALAEAVVKIGATLELQTVAEGIEVDHQLEMLQALSCDYGQGFLFARPLRAADCEALLEAPMAVSIA